MGGEEAAGWLVRLRMKLDARTLRRLSDRAWFLVVTRPAGGAAPGSPGGSRLPHPGRDSADRITFGAQNKDMARRTSLGHGRTGAGGRQ